ncbi:butyrate kinase [Alkalibacter saccharofermentans]|uniref:Probable butyrate kinase n=1 Tax=Alkalibacter saccharofermentans DSM 14828 TaxID=1120975 RepID=A0A1M4UQP6_9FIRM|nr:butyrate kinase [Alkalibacter saccharofermentans]SHE58978.1 butyrate kinase [Alkalibacter saccharofermentans DSM 14828]
MYKILVINPGSTSTRLALYEEGIELFREKINHPKEELNVYKSVMEQCPLRKDAVINMLDKWKVPINELAAVAGRGGTLRPIKSGTYIVNQRMIEDCIRGVGGHHASNLGAVIASEIAAKAGIPAFVVDPPVVDELGELARITGLPEIKRKSRFHALNQKECAKAAANELGKSYQEARIIVVHLGSGISIGAHICGQVVDVNDCYDSEGPIMPERAGTLPAGDLVKMCYSGKFTLEEMQKKLTGKGGVYAYLGTSDMISVKGKVNLGDKAAKLLYDAMAYQVSKFVGALSTVLEGNVDCIAMTGGLAGDDDFIKMVSCRVDWIAPVKVYPGEMEMEALAKGVLEVLQGAVEAKIYCDDSIID